MLRFTFDLAQGGVLKEKYICAFVKVNDEERIMGLDVTYQSDIIRFHYVVSYHCNTL